VGDSLEALLVDITSKLTQNNYTRITNVFTKEWIIFIQKCIELFESEANDGVLPCYLLYSVDEKQAVGGANGEGIFLELTNRDIAEKKFLNDVVLHEFLHKQVSPHKYFKKSVKLFRDKPELEARKLGYPDRFTSYIEEVIVYSLCDIIRDNKKTPTDKIAFYTERQRPEMVSLWKGIGDVMPMLRDYFLGKYDIPSTRKLLEDYFVRKAS
jgi:hypothetical protein